MDDPVSESNEGTQIDDGFHRWYSACPCCLSEAYPEVKASLDRETGTSAADEGADAMSSTGRPD